MTASDTPPPAALTVSDAALSRGGRRLFAGLSFSLEPGAVLFLRGANGAGKSSLLLLLAGVLRGDAGTVIGYSIGGIDEPRAPHVHLMLPQAGMKARLSVAENLAFWQAVNGPTGMAPEPALERVGLGGLGVIEAGHLSTGQLRRLALARLLVTKRPVWLLDEPTSGLDAQGDALVADLIEAHRADGGIVIAATHHDLALSGAVQPIDLGQGA